MGHYRPRRPRLHEDPMKMVEITSTAVDKIRQGGFHGFSHWNPDVPTPAVHHERRIARLRALNHNVEPRLGVSVVEARNHSLYIKAMVHRIQNRETTAARSRDPYNVNTHPVLLRRPLTFGKKRKVEAENIEQSSKKKKKIQKEWNVSTLTEWLTATNQPLKKLAPTQGTKALRRHRPGEIVVRKGTPYCFSPSGQTKLIDGTHLCERYHYKDKKTRKQYFSGADNERLKQHYKEVIDNPEGLATLITRPWKPPPPPDSTYDPLWSIDMRLSDLPSDLKVTPSRHTLEDPMRPSSSRKPYRDVFVEPEVVYDEDLIPWPVPCNTPTSGYTSGRSTRDSSRPPPGSRGCSTSRHVHRSDLKKISADALSDEMSYRFGDMIRNLKPPPEADSLFSSEFDETELEEGEVKIPTEYEPTDTPPWEWPNCCINPS